LVNIIYRTELPSHVLFNKRDPKLVQPKPCKGAETDSRGKFGKESIAGAYMRPKWVLYYDS
jgi:hypothetical protein